jgi:hypothetical protein
MMRSSSSLTVVDMAVYSIIPSTHQADLGRILPRDRAVRDQRGLLGECPFGELVGLAHGSALPKAEQLHFGIDR